MLCVGQEYGWLSLYDFTSIVKTNQLQEHKDLCLTLLKNITIP